MTTEGKDPPLSATAVLPNENPAEFKELHRSLVAELRPIGALEKQIVADLARYVWRRDNLATFHSAHKVSQGLSDYRFAKELDRLKAMDPAKREEELRPLQERQHHADIAEATTIKHLMETLDIEELLNTLIDRCLKRLLFVRGLKSLSTDSASGSARRLSSPSKTL